MAKRGLNVVRNVPMAEGQVRRLAELIAPVQRTIYGEIFDVKVETNPINIAYSDAELGFHQDLVYYESPPGMQFLHCLRFDDCITGGESRFLDIMRATRMFRRLHPLHFDTLARIPATFQKVHFERSRPVCMVYRRPHIVLANATTSSAQQSKIVAVNWAPPFEGPLKDISQVRQK